jgi:dienelactone hydrolase
MSNVLLFHHAQGLTDGVRAFADRLREAGHTVTTPDLYDGHTYATLDEGMAHAREAGFQALSDRGVAAAEGLPDDLVYVGFSLGVMPAQQLAQQRAGARAAVLCFSCVPPEEFGGPWPDGVSLQVHGMDHDPIFADEGDLEAAQALVAATENSELFVYPGDTHLFVDSSLTDHDPEAAELLTRRVLDLLATTG